ncbi:Hypothetical predicted protein [Olea europaea subsp. europaea]|uniref:Uncharacterized protein n=1 Tax=Olea europaea subsp. europaea TaxID=158383 RepID=A0A8S0UYE1_OLEEU|nr:Hypothetical predicted protein [Olea europaea subsp. europaea]
MVNPVFVEWRFWRILGDFLPSTRVATMANTRAPSPTQQGGGGVTAPVARGKTFVDIVFGRPTPLPNIEIPWKEPKTNSNGQVWYQFTHEEIQKTTEPLKFAVVLKLLRKRSSVDQIRGYIKVRWGLSEMPVIRAMRNPRHVLVRIMNEGHSDRTCKRLKSIQAGKMVEDKTRGEENLLKRSWVRQEYRPIVRLMEKGEPSKNNLPLDPVSTKYHVTDEDVEIMTGKIENKITIEQQMTHSTEEAEIVTEVLKEPGDLPKAPDFNEE